MAESHRLGFCLHIVSCLAESCCTKLSLPSEFGEDGETVWKLEPLFEIQDSGRSPSWNFFLHHFQSHEKVAVHKISLASKFGEDRCNGLEVTAISRNSRWRTVANLEFFYIISGRMKKLMLIKSVLPQNLVKIGETVWKLEPVF